MPSPGAVWPATVKSDLFSNNLLLSWMVPEVVKTIVRGPLAERMPSRNEPGPESLRLVTSYTSPPRPPLASRPNPSAPGKAGTSFSGAAVAAMASKRTRVKINAVPDVSSLDTHGVWRERLADTINHTTKG